MKPPYAIGSVPSLSGHAVAYRWHSLPRVRRHRASKPQGCSERVLPWQMTMNQLIFASLSHTHYWYEVGMLKVPAVLSYSSSSLTYFLYFVCSATESCGAPLLLCDIKYLYRTLQFVVQLLVEQPSWTLYHWIRVQHMRSTMLVSVSDRGSAPSLRVTYTMQIMQQLWAGHRGAKNLQSVRGSNYLPSCPGHPREGYGAARASGYAIIR